MTMPPTAQPVSRQDMTLVPILGMHRSGTSMFTRALNLMGVDLGEPLMEPQEDNPKGFWENEFFYEVDMRILHAIGRHVSGYGGTEQLLTVPDLSYRVERTADNQQIIEEYVEREFSASSFWGWKDPRSVLLFPFWLSTLTELGFRRIQPTIVTRHPFAVVRSLVRRTDLGPLATQAGCSAEELALQMWRAYSHILLDIADETDCYISQQESFLDPGSARSELLRCAGHLNLPVTDHQLDAALAWLDPGAVTQSDPVAPESVTDIEEALILHEDLCARARRQANLWQVQSAA